MEIQSYISHAIIEINQFNNSEKEFLSLRDMVRYFYFVKYSLHEVFIFMKYLQGEVAYYLKGIKRLRKDENYAWYIVIELLYENEC